MTFWSVLAWGLDHWGLVLSGGVFVIAFTYIISAAVYGLWLASETRKADEQRKRLDRIIQASQKAPKAAGWPHKRVG